MACSPAFPPLRSFAGPMYTKLSRWGLTPLLGLLLLGCGSGTSDDQAGTAAAAGETAQLPAADPDNGGLTLPAGFSAYIVADDLGQARHLTVAPNGALYVALRATKQGGGIVALRDTDGDGRADVTERFGEHGGTGIAVHGDHLYFSSNVALYRYPLSPGQLAPQGGPETIISGFPEQKSHAAKAFAFDGKGHVYVNVGAPSNACMEEARTKGSPGQNPCPQLEKHGGIWRFRADQTGQTQQEHGQRYATGIRNVVALDWNEADQHLYVVQHGRDQLHEFWPDRFTPEQSAELPAEEFMRVREGDNFGWPYCYFDQQQNRRVQAPEYGGDGQQVGPCAQYQRPLVAFPGHWAPNDLLFYTGNHLPDRYRNGAFVVFHGSWNRHVGGQEGYQVVFVPFNGSDPAGDWEKFADGFTGKQDLDAPGQAEHRPMGIAQGPDGTLYISDSQKGRIWRVMYTGEAQAAR
ncbi:sorbosone dehydrogenase family protein [soil metagenome]